MCAERSSFKGRGLFNSTGPFQQVNTTTMNDRDQHVFFSTLWFFKCHPICLTNTLWFWKKWLCSVFLWNQVDKRNAQGTSPSILICWTNVIVMVFNAETERVILFRFNVLAPMVLKPCPIPMPVKIRQRGIFRLHVGCVQTHSGPPVFLVPFSKYLARMNGTPQPYRKWLPALGLNLELSLTSLNP